MIRGLVKCSLVDYPGLVCATLFTGGCNLRCPYCHNKGLVLTPDKYPVIAEDELIGFLEERVSFLDGVCISGGEPTCYGNIYSLAKKIKDLGYKVKIDTNGFHPNGLRSLLDNSLVDYVALDIKSSPDKYEDASGLAVNLTLLEETLKLLRESKVKHELRTTMVPGLVNNEDLIIIGKEFGGDEPYFLQQFRPDKGLLSPDYAHITPYNRNTLLEMAAALKPFFSSVNIRGV